MGDRQAKPKTEESAGTIALDAGTVAVLVEHRTRYRAERVAAGDGWVESGFVFTELDGSPLHSGGRDGPVPVPGSPGWVAADPVA